MTPHPQLLFQELSSNSIAELNAFDQILDRILKPKAAHLKSLPRDIADLSFLLTENRDELTRPYWAEARLKAAYLWYFLPWNLVRLTPLLSNLDLDLKDGDNILDLGSGPLTLVLALWIARPDLHKAQLSFHCNDAHLSSLQSGLALFNSMAGDNSAWQIRLLKGNIKEALKKARSGKLKLISALNMLNELKPDRKQSLSHLIENTVSEMRSALAPDGNLLLVEPGNRLGGKIIELAREAGIKKQLSPILPCPHRKPCPMLAPGRGTWCHFIQEKTVSPEWLDKLSQQAKLSKIHTAVSFVLLTAEKNNQDKTEASIFGRIISNPFKVPGQSGFCRYACTKNGLALVPDALKFVSGSLLTLYASGLPPDPKTGAQIMTVTALKSPKRASYEKN